MDCEVKQALNKTYQFIFSSYWVFDRYIHASTTFALSYPGYCYIIFTKRETNVLDTNRVLSIAVILFYSMYQYWHSVAVNDHKSKDITFGYTVINQPSFTIGDILILKINDTIILKILLF
ncbi:hypothetical protein EWD94_21705 [Salmonella enterica subsp. enterica serovar Newport]|nr:hypothetical protein [Salmonella enterica subsp. enterica serovar Newport]